MFRPAPPATRLTVLGGATALTVALSTFLTGCGGNNEDSPTTIASSDAVTGPLPRFDDAAGIRDALADTDWECMGWSDIEEGLASCIVDGGAGDDDDDRANGDTESEQSIHGVYIKEQPGHTAVVIFQSEPETPAVVIGNNWVFDCGPGNSLSVDQCGEIADILGGMIVLPEPE